MERSTVIQAIAASCLLAWVARTTAQDGCLPVWSPLGDGAEFGVLALATMDEDGPGPVGERLFVSAGVNAFAGVMVDIVARWDGWQASALGEAPGKPWNVAECLLPVPVETGGVPRGLYASGGFDEVGGQPFNNLARWDGKTWKDVGGGLTSDLHVHGFASCIFDEDGDGPLPPYLYVGGKFDFAGGVAASSLARWDGQSWSAVGAGLGDDFPVNLSVYALTVFDDGRGPALYVGGSFYYAGGQKAYNIARWDGQNWEPLGGVGHGLDATVKAFAVYDEDGPGPQKPALFVGGPFSGYVGGPPQQLLGVARWDGAQWSSVGGWAGGGTVPAMQLWQGPDDDRENLYIGGSFGYLPDGAPANFLARWNGSTWRDVGGGVGGGVDTLATFDEDGDGPNRGGLYVGGIFYEAGDIPAHHIARWGCPLGPRCDTDLDRNGTLDLFDFLAFLNLFNAEDSSADCDASGSLDLFDFLCFTNAFNQGC